MNFLEKDLEDIIFNTDNEKLRARGLRIYGQKLRQVNLGSYGIADLITVKTVLLNQEWHEEKGHKLVITIYELKKDSLGFLAFGQLCRYKTAIERMFQKSNIFDYFVDYEINMVLVGKDIELKNDFCYLVNNTEFLKTYTYSYGIDGLEFNQTFGWKMSGEVLKTVPKFSYFVF